MLVDLVAFVILRYLPGLAPIDFNHARSFYDVLLTYSQEIRSPRALKLRGGYLYVLCNCFIGFAAHQRRPG